MVDLNSGKLLGSVALGSRPGEVAVGAGGVSVTLPDRGAVVQIDPKTLTQRDSIDVGADPSGIAIDGDNVWVTNGDSSTVSRISATTGQVVQTIDDPGGPTGIVVGRGGVWVANSLNASVSHLDAESGKLLDVIPVGDAPVDLALDQRGLWVANSASDTVSLVDPATDRELQAVPVGNGPDAVVAGPDGEWVANYLDGTVARINTDTNGIDQAIPVGKAPTALALGGGAVWVTDGSNGSVASFEPGAEAATVTQLGSQANDIALGDGVMWVTVRALETSHRGGTLTVWGPSFFFDSIDPALAYTALTWNFLTLTNDGLVGYRRTGGLQGATLIPDLAQSLPAPTGGGRTYTFQLRPGLRYSNGEPVRPEDFRRAIERVFGNLDASGAPSAGVQYFAEIVGGDKCTPGQPCNLSSGIIADDTANRVTFQLRAPDPDFLYFLAMPFAFPVPEASPDVLARGDTFPATGPYMVDTYEPGKGIVLVRNPAFSPSASRPDGFPDRIVWRLGSDQDAMVSSTLRGDADLVFVPPPDRIADLGQSHAGQLHITPRPNMTYLSLNASAPPFDNIKVRRALNFAIDRAAMAKLAGDDLGVACQILPPNLPGFSPYCPYTGHPGAAWSAPDLTTAQRLVNESGTYGTKVTVWASDGAYLSVPIGRYVTGLLAKLGYDATLHLSDPSSYYAAIEGLHRLAQIGVDSWTADYVTESGFITPLVACGAATNWTGLCDPSTDQRMKNATQLRATDPAGANEEWSTIEHDLVDRALFVPFGTRYWVQLVSGRLGNYQSAPQWGPLVDQMWIR
jgi:peptide/nickel transport system substrate-binding protein